MSRSIKTIIEPQYVIEGAGVLLRRSFGPQRSNLFDPFLLFDHFAFNDPKEGPIVGFPMHPHRGIETVTYILEGSVNHRDSLGNSGLIGPGDVQWMTSGRGIMHEEMPRRGPSGIIAGFQLWVNLPAALKMSQSRAIKKSALRRFRAPNATARRSAWWRVKSMACAAPSPKSPRVPSIWMSRWRPERSLSILCRRTMKCWPMSSRERGSLVLEAQAVEAVSMVVFDEGDQIEVQR